MLLLMFVDDQHTQLQTHIRKVMTPSVVPLHLPGCPSTAANHPDWMNLAELDAHASCRRPGSQRSLQTATARHVCAVHVLHTVHFLCCLAACVRP